MRRRVWLVVVGGVALLVAYLLAWPVPIDPVAWDAPPDPGYSGDFERNSRLAAAELWSIEPDEGPEDVVVAPDGTVYASVHAGWIVRRAPGADGFTRWVETGGRPLGLVLDGEGRLLIADAYRGVLRADPAADPPQLTVLADQIDGQPIVYANQIDVADDGTIYFSEASMKFGAEANGGSYEASVLDINEHQGNGRLCAIEPTTGSARELVGGLQFANGVAVSHDQRSVLVAETGSYRVVRWWRAGPKAGQLEPVIGPLPGFPDNLTRGLGGRYWLGLASPRRSIVDNASNTPFLRRIFERLPAFVKPQAVPYGHVLAFDDSGEIIADLQAPEGPLVFTTGAFETATHLHIASLRGPALGRLPIAEVLR